MAILRLAAAKRAAARLASSCSGMTADPRTLPTFKITRHPPLMVAPDRPTPRQSLYLSNVDDQLGLRYQMPKLLFYRNRNDSCKKNVKDPVRIIKEALAKVLVHYHPFAGRLRDADNGKLTVDCTGEGILFVEADADISLEDFGDLYPPIPRGDEFIANVPGSENITDTPLFLIQVTRLRCGGFVLGLRSNHCMSDGAGIVQFLNALSEIARGAANPSVPPVWNREILRPRARPILKFPHDEYDETITQHDFAEMITSTEEMSTRCFFFGSREIEALKRRIEGSGKYTSFEAVSACLWQSQTKALNLPADQDSRLLFAINCRSRFRPLLPDGYYGNAIFFGCSNTKVRNLTEQPLSFAAKLISEGKRRVDEEYMRSVIDFLEVKRGPRLATRGGYILTDLSKVGYQKADFGWGEAVYAGLSFAAMPTLSFFSVPLIKGFQGIAVPVCLPSVAMEKFEEIVYNTIATKRILFTKTQKTEPVIIQ